MTAYNVRYSNGSSALKPVCSRYRNENERIIDYSRAAHQWDSRTYHNRAYQARHERKKPSIRASLYAAVEDSATVRDLRSGDLCGTPYNKPDSSRMKTYGVMYTLMGLAAVMSAAI